MDKTKIEWADSTWNPITGCRHKCPYCYARGIANRFVSRKGCHLVEPETYKLGDDGSETYEINEQPYYVDDETGKQFRCAYPHGFVPTIHRYRMGEYRDKKRQRNIFVGSMSDVFGEWVPDRWIREEIPDWIGVYIGDYCAKKAKKQDLSGREYKMRRSVNGRSTEVSTLWVDMLKESMIRSLYRDSDKLIQTEDEQYISRLRSQIDKARTERDRESKKYLRLWKAVRKEFGDEKAWELIEKAEE